MFDKESLQKLLSNAIPLLCKNGLPMHSSFKVDAMIGITVGNADVATLICFSESVVGDDGDVKPFDNSFQNTDCGNSVREVESETDCDEGQQDFEERNMMLQTGEQYADVKVEPCDSYATTNKTSNGKPRFQQKKKNDWSSDKGNHSSDVIYKSPQRARVFKQEIDESLINGEGGESFNDDSYIDESGEGPENESISNVDSWTANEWDANANYEQNSSHQKSIRPVSSRKPNRRPRMQRVNLNDTQSMESFGITGQNPISSSSSAGYNNLMQDICNSMMNQSTAYSNQSKGRNGTNGTLSSTSPVTCHICHATLSNALCLRNHIQGTHLALKLKRCNICGETFKWAMQLARHKKRVHGGGTYLNVYNV